MPNRAASCLLLLGFSMLGGASGSTLADDLLTKSDPEVRARFQKVADAYRSLAHYEDRGSFLRTIQLAGRERAETSPLNFKFARPGKIVLDTGEVRVVADGKTITTILVPTKRYMTAPSSSGLDATVIADGSAGAILLGGASGPPAQLLLKLLLGVEAATALPDRATAIKAEPDRTIEGKAYPALRIELGDEPALRLVIDPVTHLIRRMEYLLDTKSTAGRLPAAVGEVGEMAIAWDSGPIRTDPIADDAFAFSPPAGFSRLKAAEAAAPAGKAAKNELLGKLAPEFTLTMLDGPGKTKKVTRADLAGKVVVLDFWATWCPPCLQELPEIQKLAESYAKAGKNDVVIVAVSQDRAPEDGSPVRTLVESLLKAKDLNLTGGPIAKVALDPNQDTGDAFKVQALPTVVILDAKGVVQAVHVGYSEDVKDVLTTAIDALLEGKTLTTPDSAPAGAKLPTK
jgi:thiol-disulfide isomerase/thioredoxin